VYPIHPGAQYYFALTAREPLEKWFLEWIVVENSRSRTPLLAAIRCEFNHNISGAPFYPDVTFF
jgi:hypothetical protein